MTKQTRTKVPDNVDRVTCNGKVKYQMVMTNEQIEQLKKVRDNAPDETTNINLSGTCLRIENDEIHAFYGDKNYFAVNRAILSDLKGIRLLEDINTIIEQYEENLRLSKRVEALESNQVIRDLEQQAKGVANVTFAQFDAYYLLKLQGDDKPSIEDKRLVYAELKLVEQLLKKKAEQLHKQARELSE